MAALRETGLASFSSVIGLHSEEARSQRQPREHPCDARQSLFRNKTLSVCSPMS